MSNVNGFDHHIGRHRYDDVDGDLGSLETPVRRPSPTTPPRMEPWTPPTGPENDPVIYGDIGTGRTRIAEDESQQPKKVPWYKRMFGIK